VRFTPRGSIVPLFPATCTATCCWSCQRRRGPRWRRRRRTTCWCRWARTWRSCGPFGCVIGAASIDATHCRARGRRNRSDAARQFAWRCLGITTLALAVASTVAPNCHDHSKGQGRRRSPRKTRYVGSEGACFARRVGFGVAAQSLRVRRNRRNDASATLRGLVSPGHVTGGRKVLLG